MDELDLKYIAEKLGAIEAVLKEHNAGQIKITLALIGVIAAQIGMKFVNSPPWVLLGSYSAFFTGAVLIASTFLMNDSPLIDKLCRFAFGVFVLYSCIVKLAVYEYGTPAPWWFSPSIDYSLAVLCALFTLHTLMLKRAYIKQVVDVVILKKKK